MLGCLVGAADGAGKGRRDGAGTGAKVGAGTGSFVGCPGGTVGASVLGADVVGSEVGSEVGSLVGAGVAARGRVIVLIFTALDTPVAHAPLISMLVAPLSRDVGVGRGVRVNV